MFKSKRLPVTYYGLEACPVDKSQTKSFQYVVNCRFGKMLNVRSKENRILYADVQLSFGGSYSR